MGRDGRAATTMTELQQAGLVGPQRFVKRFQLDVHHEVEDEDEELEDEVEDEPFQFDPTTAETADQF